MESRLGCLIRQADPPSGVPTPVRHAAESSARDRSWSRRRRLWSTNRLFSAPGTAWSRTVRGTTTDLRNTRRADHLDRLVMLAECWGQALRRPGARVDRLRAYHQNPAQQPRSRQRKNPRPQHVEPSDSHPARRPNRRTIDPSRDPGQPVAVMVRSAGLGGACCEPLS